jgi:tRNA-Thr(GGU) m(6)t(6)A37 methyltransferase TsaA
MDITRRDLVFKSVGMAACAPVSAFGPSLVKAETAEKERTKMFFKLYPVGRVQKKDKTVKLKIFDRYADALKGLDGLSHVWVLYWFDKNDMPRKRSILQVHPRGNRENPLTGVFACRAPVRPNLIALSLCRILSVKAAIVQIDKIDAFDDTPILDLKPYIAGIDRPTKDVRLPNWLKR